MFTVPVVPTEWPVDHIPDQPEALAREGEGKGEDRFHTAQVVSLRPKSRGAGFKSFVYHGTVLRNV
jgi:hypothetical protein